MSTQTNPPNVRERGPALRAFEQLEEALEHLATSIAADTGRPALVHALPYKTSIGSGEPAPALAWNEPPLEGDRAREHAIAEITRLRCHPDQDSKAVTRAPGALAASAGTLEAALAVNVAKENFWKAARQISPRDMTRRRKLKHMVPNISMRQAGRQIKTWNHKPSKISFSWARWASSTKRTTAREMDAELARRLHHESSLYANRERWKKRLEYARQRLAELPGDEPLAIHTMMPPHVLARVHPDPNFSQAGGRRPTLASLPFLYRDDGKELMPVKPLAAYTPPTKPHRPSASCLEQEPLVEELCLYRYKDR